MLFITPFIGWFVSGVIKFIINYLKHGKNAKKMVGNGGFPSTHTTVVVSTTAAIGFQGGFDTDIFALGVAFCFIVMLDAMGIRRALGEHAKDINNLNALKGNSSYKQHREKQGHSRIEVLGGIGVGIIVGWIVSLLF
ncbi:divergent PAP2 family protein [Paenibacillus phytohabitans]|uniref:divergent PAP2 family protein n=1 Tax=Paenibacillus phytohabitans TaxID=2654978 RepID=UPI00300BA5DC